MKTDTAPSTRPTLALFRKMVTAEDSPALLRTLLAHEKFRHSPAMLPIALGTLRNGEPLVADLATMPNLLLAGQQNSGKAAALNSILSSLLFQFSPEQLRLIMVDLGGQTLSHFNAVPHLLSPIITDKHAALNALRWVWEEMARREALLNAHSVPNVATYNAKIAQSENAETLSHLVFVVGELAELMLEARNEVGIYAQYIAKKAEALGVHLIFASELISELAGEIIAAMPHRLVFQLQDELDSLRILQKSGAEMLAQGELFYRAPNAEPVRLQSAIVFEGDVQNIADFWRALAAPNYLDAVTAPRTNFWAAGDDPIVALAATFVQECGEVSISRLQRQFSLGFNRAMAIVEQLEAQGVVSAPNENGKREVIR